MPVRRRQHAARLAWIACLWLASDSRGAETLFAFGPEWVDGPVMRGATLGPKAIPFRLEGRWQVSLCVKPGFHLGHAWIRYVNVYSGEVHTIGRFRDGVRAVKHRETGELLYEAIRVSGLHWDHDLRYEHEVRAGEYLQGTVAIDDPWVFRGDAVFGHGVVRNNCITYARDAWEFYSGQRLDLAWIHTPEGLLKSVDGAAAEVPRR